MNSVGLHTLPRPMTSFLRAYPQVNLRLVYRRTDEVYQACLEGSADLGIVAFPSRRPQLELVPLRPDELVVACPPEHPLAQRARLSAANLRGERFIGFDRDIPTRRLVDRLLRARGATVDVTMEFDNIETIKRSVEAGLGILNPPPPRASRTRSRRAPWPPSPSPRAGRRAPSASSIAAVATCPPPPASSSSC